MAHAFEAADPCSTAYIHRPHLITFTQANTNEVINVLCPGWGL